MRRPHWQLLAVAGLLIGSPSVHADDPEIRYYDVVGNSASALRAQLDAKRPHWENGEKGNAFTKWIVSWNYKSEPVPDGCVFADLQATVTGTITLPRWTYGPDTPPSLVKKWQIYIAAVRVHEDGHYAHGLAAAQEIVAASKSFRASGDCSTLLSQFMEHVAPLYKKYANADAEYDIQTQHGKTQGAIVP